jgi:hypothetical protein
MAQRGRPKELHEEDIPRQYIQTFIDDEGIKYTWKYDLDKFEYGPIEVDVVYPSGYKPIFEKQEEQKTINSKIPLKYQTFLNPKNGKQVSYQRAKQLGII